jgi:two-component system cell cycle sensor histidine kinase/response regulator CckA
MTSRSESSRIDRIVKAVSKAAAGDCSVRLDTSKMREELIPLAEAVNDLVAYIDERITRLQKTEEALQEIEEKYRRLEANIPGLVYQYVEHPDGSHSFPYTNEASRGLFDIEPEELMRDGTLLSGLIHPDDRQRRDESIKQSAETLQPWRQELRHIVNGRVRWYDCMSRPEPQDNGDILWYGIMLEITDRKSAEEALQRSEARHRQVVETMNEALNLIDADGVLTYVNRQFCGMLGSRAKELVGRKFIDLLDESNRQIWLKQNRKRKKGASTTYEMELTRKDGRKLACVASGAPFLDREGRFSGSINVFTDITALKHAEEKLKKYQGMLDESQRLALIGSWELDLNTNTFIWSDEAYRIFGLKPQERRLSLEDFVGTLQPEYEKKLTNHLNKTLRTRVFEDLEYRIVRPDGTLRWIYARGKLFTDRNGKPQRIVGTLQDTTERRQEEEELRKLQFSVAQAPEEVSWMNQDGGFSYANEQACMSLGYTCEELLGLHVWDIDPNFSKERWALQWERLRTIGSETFETSHRRKDGSVYPVEVSAKHIFFGDNEFHVVFVRDISERKRAEEALQRSTRLLMDSERVARLGHFTFDAGTGQWHSSEFLNELLGIEADFPKDLDGWLRLVHPDYRDEISSYLSKNVFEEHQSFDREYKIVRPADNQERWVHCLGRLEFDAEGKLLRMIGTVQDVSDRKQLEEQLLQSQKIEAVGKLAGGVAHDFNNMLGVILGYTELIKSRLSSGDALLKEVAEIEKAAAHSRDVTRQLLAFSRKQIIAPKTLNLNKLIADTKITLSRLIGENIDLRFFPEEDLWKIRFDPSQIEQILVNLAVNAHDAMPAGGKLTIETANIVLKEEYCRVHVGFRPGDYILLVVSDNGAGMDKETLSHIFEPFFTTKEVDKGTGLGLPTVYGIVKQNGGSVNVYSEAGRGTTFKIYIPRIMEERETTKAASEAPLASGSGTILLVEDDDMVRKMTSAMLQELGYTVVIAATPSEAVSLCEGGDTPVDLLLTDVVMPELSGIALQDKIEKIRPEIKVLFMSGYTANVIVHHGVLDKGVSFIQKPFCMNDLARKIRDVLKGK